MTIVSSASTTRRWTNRESLHKDQDSWNMDSCRTGDCLLHEQIVILFPCCKVLSKEQRSRLKE
jgi:hypothetical protein